MTSTANADPARTGQVRIVVNGDERTVPGGLTASGLLTHLGLRPGMVVVELNKEILRGDDMDRTRISDGDRVELVHFVGGG